MAGSRRSILRFFGSYLLVVMPLLIISIIGAKISMHQFQAKEEQVMQQLLEKASYQLNVWYQSHYEKSIVLFQNRVLLPEDVLVDSGSAAQAITLLNNVREFDMGTEDIFVYYGEGAIYSAKGKSRPSAYFGVTLRCEEESVRKAMELLTKEERSVTFLRTLAGENYVLYHFPVEVCGTHPCSIQYLVPLSYWQEQFGTLLTNYEVILEIEIDSTQIYLQNSENLALWMEEDSARKRIGTGYDSIAQELIAEGMSIQLYYGPQVSHQSLQRFQGVQMGLLVVGAFMSTILSFVMGHRGGRTFQQMEQIIQENRQVEKDADIYRKIMLSQTSRLLFHGLLKETQTVSQVLCESEMELFEEYYCLCSVWFDNENQAKEFAGKYVSGLADMVAADKGYMLVFLLEVSNNDPFCRQRLEKAVQTREKLIKFGIENPLVAYSQVYQELSLANCAYMESVTLLDSLRRRETEEFCWEEYSRKQKKEMKQLPEEWMGMFLDAVVEQKLWEARDVLRKMRNYMASNSLTDQNKIYLRSCILQVLISALRKSGQEKTHEMIMTATEIETAQENRFYEQVDELLLTLCADIGQDSQFNTVITYIEQNYSRYDLSLEEIAERVNVSKVKMSKLFKAQMGCCYIDYLTRLRMEKARTLLEETDLSVKEILSAVGYIDKANFSKKFKAYYGISPSAWRKQEEVTNANQNSHK